MERSVIRQRSKIIHRKMDPYKLLLLLTTKSQLSRCATWRAAPQAPSVEVDPASPILASSLRRRHSAQRILDGWAVSGVYFLAPNLMKSRQSRICRSKSHDSFCISLNL